MINFIILVLVVGAVFALLSNLAQQPNAVGHALRQLKRWIAMLFAGPGWPSRNADTDIEWEVLEPSRDNSANRAPARLPEGLVWAGYFVLAVLFLAIVALLFIVLGPFK